MAPNQLPVGLSAHVEFQLPIAAVPGDALQLEDAGFGEHGFEVDGATSVFSPALKLTPMGQFFEFVAEVLR